jgi:hypothetical protein
VTFVGFNPGFGVVIIADSTGAPSGWLYGHIRPESLNVNDTVSFGQALGTIENFDSAGTLDSFDHLHFQNSRPTGNLDDAFSDPLNHLRPFPTQLLPIIDSVYFVKDQDTTFPHLSKDSLFLDVDIITQAWTKIQPAPPDSNTWKAGINKIGYSVTGRDSSSSIPFRTLVHFKGAIPHPVPPDTNAPKDSTKYFLVYRTVGHFKNHYIVTNSRDTTVGQNGFNNIKENKWDTDVALSDPTGIPYPKYPDGPYSVIVKVWEYQVNPEIGTPPESVAVDVVLDNYVPSVKRVVIEQGGTKIFDSDSAISHPAIPDSALDFTLYFSEEMQTDSTPNVTYGVNSPFDADTLLEVKWDTTTYPNDTWKGTATPDTSLRGSNRLKIIAWDLVGHELDSIPTTVASRDSTGQWQNYEQGPDVNHTFRISHDAKIFVADPNGNRIRVFDFEGNLVDSIGYDTLYKPVDVALDTLGNIYVADSDTNDSLRVLKFDSLGNLDAQSINLAKGTPMGITTDGNSIYFLTNLTFPIADSIFKLDSDLTRVLGWPIAINISFAGGIEYSPLNHWLYVTISDNPTVRVDRYDTNGVLVDSTRLYEYWFSHSSPAVDSTKFYIIADDTIIANPNNIAVYDSSVTTKLDTFIIYERGDGLEVDQKYVYYHGDDSLYIIDKGSHSQVRKFSTGTGNYIPRGIALSPPYPLSSTSSIDSYVNDGSEILTIGIGSSKPNKSDLSQNAPNPFNRDTVIRYQLTSENHVRLDIYDVTGRAVATLVNDIMEAGYHTIKLDRKDISSGIYFVRFQVGDFSATKKIVLIR